MASFGNTFGPARSGSSLLRVPGSVVRHDVDDGLSMIPPVSLADATNSFWRGDDGGHEHDDVDDDGGSEAVGDRSSHSMFSTRWDASSQFERSHHRAGQSQAQWTARDDTVMGRGAESLLVDDMRGEASALGAADPRWVTVFGFPRSRTTEILHLFRKYGEFLDHRTSSGNWVHLCYATKLQAQQALAKNGKIINGDLMIGVVCCTEENVWTRPLTAPAATQPRQAAIAAVLSTKQPSSMLPAALPQPSSGFWSSFLSHVFGF